ncbi:MAG TPA: hypothetical protein V6C88_13075 [Chroococcidiopsis sp.]
MSNPTAWYIVKTSDGHCEILSHPPTVNGKSANGEPEVSERWGPFSSEEEAIARRVGLIRAGKCLPL